MNSKFLSHFYLLIELFFYSFLYMNITYNEGNYFKLYNKKF
jgi:hypothetical protein